MSKPPPSPSVSVEYAQAISSASAARHSFAFESAMTGAGQGTMLSTDAYEGEIALSTLPASVRERQRFIQFTHRFSRCLAG